MKKILIAIGIGSVLWGAYNYYKIQASILTQTTYNISSVKIKEANSNRITFGCVIDVQNNSDFQFEIKNYNIDVILNDFKLGSIVNPSLNQVFKGGGVTSKIEFDFTFNPKEIGIWGMVLQLIQNKKQSNVRFIGDINISKGILSFSIPIDFTYKLKEFM